MGRRLLQFGFLGGVLIAILTAPLAGQDRDRSSADGLAAAGVHINYKRPATAPLIVVDGVLVSAQSEEQLITALVGRTIQSVRVLAVAAAEREYGSKAAAGILILTTQSQP